MESSIEYAATLNRGAPAFWGQAPNRRLGVRIEACDVLDWPNIGDGKEHALFSNAGCLMNILAQLKDAKDLASASCVSRLMNCVSKTESLWRNLYLGWHGEPAAHEALARYVEHSHCGMFMSHGH